MRKVYWTVTFRDGTETWRIVWIGSYITCWPIGKFFCFLWQHCSRPWSFTCEPCSFDRTGFVWVRRVLNGSVDPKSRHARCVPSYDFSTQKVIIQRNFTNKLLLFMVKLWIGKMWRSSAVNSPKEGLMFMTNKGAVGYLSPLTTFFRKLKEKFVQIDARR